MTEEDEKLINDIKRKQDELKLREDDLKFSQGIVYQEHTGQTQTIERISRKVVDELAASGHICVRGEQIGRIEAKIDTLLENQAGIKKDMGELFDGRNSNSRRLDRIESIGSVAIALLMGAWAFVVFIWDKVAWK